MNGYEADGSVAHEGTNEGTNRKRPDHRRRLVLTHPRFGHLDRKLRLAECIAGRRIIAKRWAILGCAFVGIGILSSAFRRRERRPFKRVVPVRSIRRGRRGG